jgi:ribonuclease P protein component
MKEQTSYRNERLRRKVDFKTLFQKGFRIRGKTLSIQALQRNGASRRIAFVASRKVGNAVKRNRAKRLMREVYYSMEDSFPEQVDLVFMADESLLTKDISELKEHMLYLIAQCHAQIHG